MAYCYLSGLEKTLCKWDIYVLLVTKGLKTRRLTVTFPRLFLQKAWDGGWGMWE